MNNSQIQLPQRNPALLFITFFVFVIELSVSFSLRAFSNQVQSRSWSLNNNMATTIDTACPERQQQHSKLPFLSKNNSNTSLTIDWIPHTLQRSTCIHIAPDSLGSMRFAANTDWRKPVPMADEMLRTLQKTHAFSIALRGIHSHITFQHA